MKINSWWSSNMPILIKETMGKYQLQYKLPCYLWKKIPTWVNELTSTYASSHKQKTILRVYTAGRDPDLQYDMATN